MKQFLDDDFLLESRTAVELYREHAAPQPIIDYHCHLSPELIASNHRFTSMTELWLQGDHYKWRAMRTEGVPERCITGEASDWEKFEAWAHTVPRTLRNPLYHWTHLELKFPFGIRGERLAPASARRIYEHCNRCLAEDGFTTQGLLEKYNVLVVCSTDDPADDLEPHRRHAANTSAKTKLFPTWRPDKAFALGDLRAWNAWVDRLGEAAGVSIATHSDFMQALASRHDAFHERGCRASDHGLERLTTCDVTSSELRAIFDKARAGAALAPGDADKYQSALLHELAELDWQKGWVQQFHLGALRNTNTRAARRLGPDTGYDAIGDFSHAQALARFLDRLDRDDRLARTIVYNSNPADNEVFATLIGCFQDGSTPGKLQLGSAWWFLDQLDGMKRQIDALSNMGLLSRFVGMLTDSRSFLSYSRHDYFRRLLCNILGDEVERGLLPDDAQLLGSLVRDVCFGNARRYFDFDL
ncbi:MAG TPA: glucuronate isomerase [Polyangiaceae bacterium]|nr:glucuronate isomerase [Polyangiaceae bacterium]